MIKMKGFSRIFQLHLITKIVRNVLHLLRNFKSTRFLTLNIKLKLKINSEQKTKTKAKKKKTVVTAYGQEVYFHYLNSKACI